MAKLGTFTNVTAAQEFKIEKAASDLIICSSYAPDAFLNELITITLVRKSGNNFVMANKIPFKDYMIASTYGNPALQSNGAFATIAKCPLALGGALELAEGEYILVRIDNPRTAGTYELYYLEDARFSPFVYGFEQKVIAANRPDEVLKTHGFDVAVITTHASIDSYDVLYSTGTRIRSLPFELEVESKDVDPIQALSGNDVVQALTGKLALPLASPELSIEEIIVNKTPGTDIYVTMRAVYDLSA